MTSELKALKTSNILAIGLVGFSGAFGFFLLRGVFLEHAGPLASALNLAASLLLFVACALAWPQLAAPTSARVSWRTLALVGVGCVLSLVARAPSVVV